MYPRLSEIMFGNIVATYLDPFRSVLTVLTRFQVKNDIFVLPERFFQLLARYTGSEVRNSAKVVARKSLKHHIKPFKNKHIKSLKKSYKIIKTKSYKII